MRTTVILLCLALLVPSAFAQTDAKATFGQKCAICHGTDGKSMIPMGKKMGSPDLTSPEIQKHSDAEIRKAIADGKGKMPPYGAGLGKDGLDAMVKYIRSLATK